LFLSYSNSWLASVSLFVAYKAGQGVQCPTLALVAQGSKQIMLGDEAFTYDPGHYLVVSLDLPVSGRVTAASKAKPFLGMSLDLDVKQIPSLRTYGRIQRATKPDRGVFLSRMTPELLEPVNDFNSHL